VCAERADGGLPAKVDATEALVRADLEVIDGSLHRNAPIPVGFQARLGRDLSYVVKTCGQGVDRLATAIGAHSMLDENPVQRAARDIHAIANHAVNNWEFQAIGYARARIGLPQIPMF